MLPVTAKRLGKQERSIERRRYTKTKSRYSGNHRKKFEKQVRDFDYELDDKNVISTQKEKRGKELEN